MTEPDDFATAVLERLAPIVDVGAAFAAFEHRSRVLRRRRLIGRASAAVGLVALAGTVAWRIDDNDTSTAITTDPDHTPAPTTDGHVEGTVTVGYEVIAYEQTFEGTCPDGEVNIDGEFDTMTFESWGSEELGRWRQTVTYPNTSTRNYWATEDPFYPAQTHLDGTWQGHTYTCGDINIEIVLAEPGQNSWFTLNPTSSVKAPGGGPAILTYRSQGEPVPGDHTGPDGQTVELWRQQVDGFIGDHPVQQVTEWLVDPATGLVVERRWTQALQDLSVATWTARLIDYGDTTIDRADLEPPALPPLDSPSSVEGAVLTETTVAPDAELGSEWVWPATPIPGETLDHLARRFADLLGWDTPTIDTGDPTGPTANTLHGPDNRTLTLLTIPTPDGPVIIQIGQASGSIGIAAGARYYLDYAVPANTATVDIYVSDGTTTRGWTTTDTTTRPLLPPDLNSLHSALIIPRDNNGTAITANGGHS